MATSSEKQFSMHVSKTLDCLGKSQDMIEHRVKMYREIPRQYSSNIPHKVIFAGSKGEGVTALFESDYDQMFVIPEIICADNAQDFINEGYATLFKTERNDTPAGYTELKLVKLQSTRWKPVIEDSLFQVEGGEMYLSSEFITTRIAQSMDTDPRINLYERSGPSLPASNTEGNLNFDLVYAFDCVCPDLLKAFIKRPRLYNRPARNMLDNISNLESHVVPVGYKGCDTSYQQWRICFTKAELHLVQRFNDTETKLYILLKMVSKILKKISDDITSYVMKNIVLWLVELYPVGMFTEELLTTRLNQALIVLKKCVEVNFLPSYIIPGRNLLAGRLDQSQRCNLTTALSTLIHEGGKLLLRCEKLPIAMLVLYRKPAMAKEFRWRRDIFEKVVFLKEKILLDKHVSTGHVLAEDLVEQMLSTDETYRTIIKAMFNIVIPDMCVYLRQGHSHNDIFAIHRERAIQLLS